MRSVAELTLVDIFDKEYGKDLYKRFMKMKEEFIETEEAFNEYMALPSFNTKECEKHLIDELSDLQATLTHFAHLFGLYQQELLHSAIDKVKGRKIDPNYKRKINSTEIIGVFHEKTFGTFIEQGKTKKLGQYVVEVGNEKYLKPDHEFYLGDTRMMQAMQGFLKGGTHKMIECNQDGTYKNYHDKHVLFETGINIIDAIRPPDLKD